MKLSFTSIVLSCLSIVGCAGTVVSSEPAPGASAVGQLRWKSDIDERRAACTGTLVARDLVLSARHCLYDDDGRNRADIGKWQYSLGGASAETATAIDEIWTAPIIWSHHTDDWNPPFGMPDLAILHLATPITSVAPLSVSVSPVALAEPSFLTVGYGTGKHASSATSLRALEGQPVHEQYASLPAFRAALSSSLGVPEASFDADESERIQQWYDLSLTPGYEAHAGPADGDGSACAADSGAPLVRPGPDGSLQVYGVRQHALGLEPASRLCALGAVYALFDNQESRDFLDLFGLIQAKAPSADAQQQCTQCNGEWGIHGLSQTPGCNCRTTDYGQACNAGNQCQGECLVDRDHQVEVEAGPPALGYFTGQCAEFVTSFGCHDVAPPELELFDLGERPPTVCFD